ncbi:MAG: phosphatase PAP2 family protein [Acidobacteria bacterium]|nr:phosphatase PAP2 family protein [Acidobacteriota bacterium]
MSFATLAGALLLFTLMIVSPAEAQPGSEADPAAAPATPAAAPLAPAAAAATRDQPFRRFWPNFIGDLRRYPSLDSLVVLGAGGLLSVAALNSDVHFTAQASAGGTDQIFAVGGGLGDGYVQVGLAVGTYAAGALTGHRTVTHVGADLIRAQAVTGVLTHAIKLATRRARPHGDHDTLGRTYSFPSGHSSATWSSATVLWRHLGWKVGVPASLLAAYASASRLQQNEHFMSDVLFGAALGIASARTVTMGHGKTRVSVTPAPVPGGGAIMFSVNTGPKS